MTYYANTSWWLALVYDRDIHHEAAFRLFDRDDSAVVLWTPWQRVEVFNGLHQMERLGVLARGDAKRAIKRLGLEVELGYWQHEPVAWTKAIPQATLISGLLGRYLPIRGMDLFHVAIARVARVERFLTFDIDQAELARAAGLIVERPG